MAEHESLSAVLIQIAEHSDRISGLSAREESHHRDVSARLADLLTAVAELRGAVTEQAEILAGLSGLDQRVAVIAERLAAAEADEDENGPAAYTPVPAVRWWKASPEEREEATARLAGWVEQIYRPAYGHLSAHLGRCWQSHPLCLFTLDWLSELWTVLYLQPTRSARTLAGQAEFHTRILPAAAELMALETTRCEHAAQAGIQRLRTGARP